MSVLDATGKPVTQSKAGVPARGSQAPRAALPPLDAGIYTVRYNVVSVDGHTVKADFQFTIKGP